MATLTVVALLGVTAAMLSVSLGQSAERNAAGAKVRAFAAANSGLAHTVANMTLLAAVEADVMTAAVGADDDAATVITEVKDVAKGLGGASLASKTSSSSKPTNAIHFGESYYWTNIADNGDGTYTVQSTGSAGGMTQTVQAVIGAVSNSSIYDNAIFAGNIDEDPLYTLDLGGWNDQADEITGNIYSGGDVDVVGDASVTGTIRANGVVTGAAGESHVSQPIVDLSAMNYESTADVDVAAAFKSSATWEYDKAGGSAYQLAESEPAHIFRLNPSDRSSETSSTDKDDYFLEDPHEKVQSDPNQNGKSAYHLTLDTGKAGGDGNNKVFYIDGNLWLHNKETYSLKFYQAEKEGLRVTFVVKGNIYISDNLFLLNKNKDGIALIAMKDDKVDDSGNIYFGDPEFGTLREMNAFMYAENNFYDYNLDASGSSVVTVRGNMTAGNKVEIQRDYGKQHTKLVVEFDDRISSGDLALPGLPSVKTDSGGSNAAYEVLSWSRVH